MLIFTAVMLEARTIAQAFDAGRPAAETPTPLSEGDPSVELRVAGIRAKYLPRQLDAKSICGIISAGIAGALDPVLAVGDVVVDTSAVGLPDHLPLRQGRILTSYHLISTTAEKATLFRQTHASAVDMETEPVRKLAEKLGVPFVSVRGISDAADHVLDPALLTLIDDRGRPKLSALGPAMLRNPGLLQSLTRIRYHANLAATAMAAVVKQLVHEQSLWR